MEGVSFFINYAAEVRLGKVFATVLALTSCGTDTRLVSAG